MCDIARQTIEDASKVPPLSAGHPCATSAWHDVDTARVGGSGIRLPDDHPQLVDSPRLNVDSPLRTG